MKLSTALSVLTLLLSSALTHAIADEPQHQTSLWERFCIEKKIGNACGKAIKSLTKEMNEAQNSEIAGYQVRIKAVAEVGCKLQDKASCKHISDLEYKNLTAGHLSQHITEFMKIEADL